MTLLVLIAVLVGLLYFSCAPRVFDWFSVAFASASVYLLPALLGYARLGQDEQALHLETYFIALAILLGILIAAMLSDAAPQRRVQPSSLQSECDFALAMTMLVYVGMIASVVQSGDALFSPKKRDMLATFGVVSLIWRMGTITGFALAFAARRKGLMTLNAVSLLFLWYLGFRSPLALAMLSSIVIWISKRGRRPVIGNVKLAAAIVCLALVVFCYKRIYSFVKFGEWDAVVQRLESDNFVTDAVLNSEAMSRLHMVNMVVSQRYTIPSAEHIRDTIVYTFDPSGKEVDPSFGGWIAADFYPHVKFGVASSIWAEMYSVGGWALLLGFIALYGYVLHWASSLTRSSCGLLRTIVCAWMPYVAFYIHRNDSYRMLSFLKQYVLLLVLCSLLVLLFRGLLNRGGSSAVGQRFVNRRALK